MGRGAAADSWLDVQRGGDGGYVKDARKTDGHARGKDDARPIGQAGGFARSRCLLKRTRDQPFSAAVGEGEHAIECVPRGPRTRIFASRAGRLTQELVLGCFVAAARLLRYRKFDEAEGRPGVPEAGRRRRAFARRGGDVAAGWIEGAVAATATKERCPSHLTFCSRSPLPADGLRR